MPAGEEGGDLGDYRKKLLLFLEKSSWYEPSRLISDFPFDGEFSFHRLIKPQLVALYSKTSSHIIESW